MPLLFALLLVYASFYLAKYYSDYLYVAAGSLRPGHHLILLYLAAIFGSGVFVQLNEVSLKVDCEWKGMLTHIADIFANKKHSNI